MITLNQHGKGRKIMDQDVNIIKAFEAADEDRRLSLFLTHRDLRPQFTDIYMADKAHPTHSTRPTSKQFSGFSGFKGNSRIFNFWLKLRRGLTARGCAGFKGSN
jgi:hypothetical protein